jgi:hypothetical protein
MGRVRMLPTPASGVRLADAVLPPGTPESVASRRVTQSRNPGRRMMGLMDIELLVVPGCRNEEPAATLLRFALVQAALPSGFRVTVIADEQEAVRRGFTGSPTFLINGSDPFGNPHQPASLGCRIYRRPDGHARGLPDLPALRDALTAAARRHAEPTNVRAGVRRESLTPLPHSQRRS